MQVYYSSRAEWASRSAAHAQSPRESQLPKETWVVNLESVQSLAAVGKDMGREGHASYARCEEASVIVLPPEPTGGDSSLRSATAVIKEAYEPQCRVIALPKSGWAQCLRNVPAAEKLRFAKQQRDRNVVSDQPFGIVVSLNSRRKVRRCGQHRRVTCLRCGLAQGRVLVLDRLQFRGNIGCIIRSAVQSNAFSHICIIRGRDDTSDQPPKSRSSAKSAEAFKEYKHTGHYFADIGYYSMCVWVFLRGSFVCECYFCGVRRRKVTFWLHVAGSTRRWFRVTVSTTSPSLCGVTVRTRRPAHPVQYIALNSLVLP